MCRREGVDVQDGGHRYVYGGRGCRTMRAGMYYRDLLYSTRIPHLDEGETPLLLFVLLLIV